MNDRRGAELGKEQRTLKKSGWRDHVLGVGAVITRKVNSSGYKYLYLREPLIAPLRSRSFAKLSESTILHSHCYLHEHCPTDPSIQDRMIHGETT